jgi:hypothetical protein
MTNIDNYSENWRAFQSMSAITLELFCILVDTDVGRTKQLAHTYGAADVWALCFGEDEASEGS